MRQLSAIGYWDTLQELAPTLSTEGRSLLFSMLWGRIERVYQRLRQALQKA